MTSLTLSLTPEGDLELSLPLSARDGTRPVRIPATPAGMETLVRILRARQAAELAEEAPAPGTPGAPVQAVVDAWIRSNGVTICGPTGAGARRLTPREVTLEDLGL